MAKVSWHGKEFKTVTLKSLNNRLLAAAKHFQNEVKRNISIPSRTGKKTIGGRAIAAVLKRRRGG